MFEASVSELYLLIKSLINIVRERIERFHVTSQSRENHTSGHFGVQLNGDLVCCMVRVQNAVQT